MPPEVAGLLRCPGRGVRRAERWPRPWGWRKAEEANVPRRTGLTAAERPREVRAGRPEQTTRRGSLAPLPPHPGPAPRGGAVNRRPVHRCGPGLPCSGRPVCTAASTASAQSLAPKEALLPSRRHRRRPGARISRPCPSAVALTRAPDALSSTLTFSRVALGRSPERRLRTFRAQPAIG